MPQAGVARILLQQLTPDIQARLKRNERAVGILPHFQRLPHAFVGDGEVALPVGVVGRGLHEMPLDGQRIGKLF